MFLHVLLAGEADALAGAAFAAARTIRVGGLQMTYRLGRAAAFRAGGRDELERQHLPR
jgi:hypothetical protein